MLSIACCHKSSYVDIDVPNDNIITFRPGNIGKKRDAGEDDTLVLSPSR